MVSIGILVNNNTSERMTSSKICQLNINANNTAYTRTSKVALAA